MKKIKHFLYIPFLLLGIVLMSIGISSCNSSKGTLACPTFHKSSGNAFAMIRKFHSIKKISSTGKHEGLGASAIRNTDSIALMKSAIIQSLEGKGTASISEDVPTRESAIEKFKSLDRDERDEAKKAIASALGKRPFLRKLALKKFDKVDEKYPAAAQHSGGGGMGAGEILSIVAIILAFLFPIVGLILGIVSLVILNGNGGAGWARGLAIAAIIIGAILTLVAIGVIVIIR